MSKAPGAAKKCPYCEWPMHFHPASNSYECGICHTVFAGEDLAKLDTKSPAAPVTTAPAKTAYEENQAAIAAAKELLKKNLIGLPQTKRSEIAPPGELSPFKKFLCFFMIPVEEEEKNELPFFSLAYASICLLFYLCPDSIALNFTLSPTHPFHWLGLNFVTYAFVNNGLLDLLCNFIFMVSFTETVEEELGSAGFIGLFLVSSILGAIVELLFSGAAKEPIYGASIFPIAILCFYTFRFPQKKLLIGFPFLGAFWARLRFRARTWLVGGSYLVLIGLEAFVGIVGVNFGLSDNADLHLAQIMGGICGILFQAFLRGA